MQTLVKREQRTEAILSSIARLDYLSRSQIQRIHRLGTARNANKVMHALRDYLSSFRDGETVYYLNRAGRERIGSAKVRKKTLQARHYLMRNELYLALRQPASWQNEIQIDLKSKRIRIITDALYVERGRDHYVEIDHTQKMSVNRAKMVKYRALIESGAVKPTPRLVWVTTTEHRRCRLTELCRGLDAKIYTILEVQGDV
jgi:hypothetical protein